MTRKVQNVPFYGPKREYEAHRKEFLSRVDEALETGMWLQGDPVSDLEERIAKRTERDHAVAVGSCTDGLFFALRSLGIGSGDQVLVTALSFVASASAIVRTGAEPVFVDVDDHYGLDLDEAANAVADDTQAIVDVNLYGGMRDPQRVEAFAREHEIALVEDAAQSFGAAYDGRPSGSVGDVSCVSFDPTKVLAAPGSGGMVLTDDPDVADTLRSLRWHGKSDGSADRLGYNSQLPSSTAAVLDVKLDHLDDWIEERQAIARRYREGLAPHVDRVPDPPDPVRHVYHKFVLETSQRDGLREHLEDHGIGTGVHYPRILPEEPLFDHESPDAYTEARRASRRVLSLPIHPFVTDDEVDYVVDTVEQFFD